MKMKQTLFALLAAALLSSCGGATCTLTGKVELTPGDSLFLVAADRDRTELGSTLVAQDSSFTISYKASEPTIAVLANKFRSPMLMLFVEPGDITVTRTQAGYRAQGTPSNDRFNRFNEQMAALQSEYYALGPQPDSLQTAAVQAKLDRLVGESVEANFDNLLGVYLFTNAEMQQLAPAQSRERMARFTEAMQAHPMMQEALRSIEAAENTEIGKPYMELTLRNTAGEPAALSSLVGTGKWVLIDFWATWCPPCIAEIPHLSEAYAAYHDRGFEIYGVSLDNDEARWKQYVSTHDMPWTNVIAVEGDKSSPAAEQYGIRSIPTNFLISPEGVIVARDLRGEALGEKLAEVIR